MTAPLVLHLPSARAYAVVMAVLLVLFLGRVVGQMLAATTAPSWLPPMARWYSGLMAYRYLLPTQIVFLVVMTAMTIAVDRRSPPLGTLSADAGAWIIWASYVYALGMVARSIRYALAKPERRGVLIPIVFHFVLAGFLFAYGSAAIRKVIPSERSGSRDLHFGQSPLAERPGADPSTALGMTANPQDYFRA